MNTGYVQDSMWKRVLWLYGLYMLLSNAAYLFGYYLLPEGFLRGSSVQAAARVVAAAGTFWPTLASTFLMNLGLLLVGGLWANLFQVKGLPLASLWLVYQGTLSGLVSGTNSFLQSDLTQFNVRDGMALNLSIGGLEFLAYVLIIASTASIAVYAFSSWKQLKPTKLKSFRDIRLSRAEVLCLVGGLGLLLVAAYRETLLAASL